MNLCGTAVLKLGPNVKEMFGVLKKETKNNKQLYKLKNSSVAICMDKWTPAH